MSSFLNKIAKKLSFSKQVDPNSSFEETKFELNKKLINFI